MNRIDLQGQVAVVTGGAQGLGLAFARRMIASGARVSLWDMNQAGLDAAVGELGDAARAVVVDITDAEAVLAAHARTESEIGGVSVLVNSAGIAGPNHTLDEYPLDAWRRVIDINLNGTFHVNRAVVPAIKARNYGRIVNIASIAGKEGNPNASAYSASKAGVIGLTKSLGKELAGYDIAVNCITPAAARTPIFDQMKQEHIDYMLSKIPRAVPGSRRGGKHGRLAGLEGKQFYHRVGLRSLRRPRHLLTLKDVGYGAATLWQGGSEKPGLVDADGKLRDLSGYVRDLSGSSLAPDALKKLAKFDPASLPAMRGNPRLGPRVAGAGKFICIGLNFAITRPSLAWRRRRNLLFS